MIIFTPAEPPAIYARRLPGLDRFRGLALLLMVLDHLLVVLGHLDHPLRFTVTRAAMPLFALLAGALVYRLGYKWAGVAAVGIMLPYAVPWIDQPNILLSLSLGAVVVVFCRCHWSGAFIGPGLLAVALTVMANGFLVPSGYFQPLAVVGLMLIGSSSWDLLNGLGARLLPGWLALLGRYPLRWYVGHVLALELLRRWFVGM